MAKAQEKVEEWRQQAFVLSRTIPPQDAVLQGALQIVGDFSQQLPVLAELSSPALKSKHWKNIFKGQFMGCAVCMLLNQHIANNRSVI